MRGRWFLLGRKIEGRRLSWRVWYGMKGDEFEFADCKALAGKAEMLSSVDKRPCT